VVMIGEIRDHETGEIAIQAALTGHLVLSTLHTNDASGAVPRLIDMGVEPYLVASTVEGVLAQRLVRRLCDACKTPYDVVKDKLPPDLAVDDVHQLWTPMGCRTCRDIGYAGRTGIFELLLNDAHIKQLCVKEASAGEIREYALSQGMMSLRQSAWQKAKAGTTSLEEVVRITRGDVI